MRKILLNSITIVFMLILLCGMDVYAKSTDDVFAVRCSLLHDLGILTDTGHSGDDYVTRAEFVSAAVRLRGMENVASDFDEGVYSDINNKHPLYRDVMAASYVGLVRGDISGRFRPDDIITSEEAGIILARVLGYTNTNIKPEDINTFISRSKILCGYSDMTWNNVAYIFEQMLDKKVIECSYGSGKIICTELKESVLEKYRSIYEYDGILQGVGDTYIGGHHTLSENQAEIDGVKYESGSLDISDYVGHRIRGYYHSDKAGRVYTIITAKVYNTKVLTVSASDLESYDNSLLEYDDGTKIRKAKTDINLCVLYNGRYYADFEPSDMLIESGYVTLIDNTNDGTYDVADIREYKTYVVDSVDVYNNKMYLKYSDHKYTIDLDADIDTVKFCNSSGETVDIREVMSDDVICVYESKEGEYVSVVMCTEEIEGTIQSVGTDSVTIDGNEYKITQPCKKNQSAYIKPGITGVFVKDIGGTICYIISAHSDDRFAYVIDCSFDKTKDKVLLRLMLEDGTIGIYSVREKMTLNGIYYKSADDLQAAMGENFRHQLVKCTTDSKGEVIKLYTQGNGGLERFYTDYDYSNSIAIPNNDNHKRTFRSSSMTIGGKVALSGNTIVMIVPNDPSKTDEKYYAVDNTYIENDKEYRVEAYRDSDEDYTADLLVIYDDVSSNFEITNNDIGISVLSKVNEAVDEEGEYTYKLEIFDGGVTKKYLLREQGMLDSIYGIYTPSKGDIIRYELKGDKINKLELIYSVQAGRIVAPANKTNEFNTNHYQWFRVWDAYVFYRWGSFMMLSETMPTDLENINYQDYDIHPCASSNIVICEQRRNMEIYAGTSDDIIGYKNTGGAECSKVVVYERWGDGKTIVIYR